MLSRVLCYLCVVLAVHAGKPARTGKPKPVPPADECPQLLQVYTVAKYNLLSERNKQIFVDFQSVPTEIGSISPIESYADFDVGPRTKLIQKRFVDIQNFWDVDTSDVELTSMSGELLTNTALFTDILLAKTGNQIFNTLDLEFYGCSTPLKTQEDVKPCVDQIVSTVQEAVGADDFGFHNPIWTVNCFAQESQKDLGYGNNPNRTIYGEGILEFLVAEGLDPRSSRGSAATFIMAHEHGHHLQFKLGFMPNKNKNKYPETRYTEMMADALGAYYCAHARGATFRAEDYLKVLMSGYDVGDCQIQSPIHHGTPLQRYDVILWAQELQQSQQKKGEKLPTLEIISRFTDEIYVHLPPI